MVRREKTNYVIQSVAHALDVLEQFVGDTEELGVTDLSKRLKLHKNNVFRLLATLESRGYIEQNKSTENYRLGIRCLQLGQSYVQHMGLLRQARPIMSELLRQIKETTYVAVFRRGGDVFNAFDDITYNKGSSFIRMLEGFLGEDVFRDGMRKYIATHKYSNSTTADLWNALSDSSGKPVGEIAAGWTQQPGFPVVKVVRHDRELDRLGLRDWRRIGAADLERVFRQHSGQLLPRARNPALDRADRTVADLGGLLIAEAADPDEH
jgi:hypothetical protein